MSDRQTATRIATRVDPRQHAVARAFLDDLVARGHLDRLAADRAYQAQRQTGERVDAVVVQLGLMSQQVLTATLAEHFNMPLATPADFTAAASLSSTASLDASFLRRNAIVPITDGPDGMVVATADPFAADTLAALAYAIDKPITAKLADRRDINRTLDAIYGPRTTNTASTGQPPATIRTSGADDDVQRLRDMASEAPVIRLVTRLISEAIEARASDIHIEPFPDSLRVRQRIDGVMTEVERLSPDLQSGIASRLKILAQLNIAERRLPQDGRVKFVLGGREIDLRVSTAPLLHGESLVLRILDRDSVTLDYAALGFTNDAIAQLDTLMAAPNGIVLVTGPTGSGKTTTLYTALKGLNSLERKVFTVEDPIEYQFPGLNQMQIKPALDLDFVQCLRSILRQDPDVVMIGEIRDAETARTAIQASLTGHLVLSTLHTNSAAASITRLLDMGVEDYLLASTVSGILAQRLVRRLCTACALPDPNGARAIETLDTAMRAFAVKLPTGNYKRPCGCHLCRNTGYRGRTTIAELLVVDRDVRIKIARGVTDRTIEDVARSGGMETLLECGLRKVAAGETTLAEVLRVARS